MTDQKQPHNLKAAAIEKIKQYLLVHRLKPGARLPPERKLADEFGVSRTVIRDAVKTLDGLGLLDVRHRVGTFVADVGLDTVARQLSSYLAVNQHTARSLLEVRLVLETATARWAATRCDGDGARRLSEMLTDLKSCADDEARNDLYSKYDRRFHILIAELSGNQVALDLMRMLLKYLAVFAPFTHHLPDRISRSLSEHEVLVRAIQNNNSRLAAAAMEDHLRATFEQIIDSWEVVKRMADEEI
jgi:GntR family transcriptional repressor for pyruvate dehydrogenase complex